MTRYQSLDELIKKESAEFADQIKKAAEFAEKEEEIRIEAERALAVIQRETGITFRGRHEYTIGTGRADSVYGCVIIEYKNPHSSEEKLSSNIDSVNNQKVIAQIQKRFSDFKTEYNIPLNTMFGVGCDGKFFIFVRYRDDRWHVEDPVEVSKYSAERFLWALINMGTKGKAFAPEYLAGDFGSESPLAQEGVRALYKTLCSSKSPKTRVFFQQWKILFGEVCGYDVNTPSDKIKKLSEFYGISATPKAAELLFSMHTYYAIFMKLLASEIVAFFHKLPTPLQKILKAPTSNKLQEEMKDLESGSIFRHLNVTNFLEGDIFAWYPDDWNDSIEKLIRDSANRLDAYNPGTLSEDPAGSRDLLKKLYQQLFPKSVRHDLGEYYTPDWLAEHVLNELDYSGDPEKRLLDPACGSGTFLVMSINRIRKWYEAHRDKCGYDEGGLARRILENVVGFDLNPLAVMAARTNYLIAMKDLVGRVDKVEIPVYLCDSIMTLSEYGGLDAFTTGKKVKTKELKTSAAKFRIPLEIAADRQSIAKYAEQLEFCVNNDFEPGEFLGKCRDEGLTITAEDQHIELYDEILKLKSEQSDGVWARIIKNAFAPLFCGSFDYVAGNPPWVRWGYLPQEYRTDVKFLWRYYGLFTQKGLRSLMGTAEVDISILFTYACIDFYLTQKGKLGFLITQEVVKSKGAGEGFRTFQLGSKTSLKVITFHDLVAIKPFEAANKTGLIVILKGSKTIYPVPYIEWKTRPGVVVSPNDELEDVLKKTIRAKKMASPLKGEVGPWQITISETKSSLSKLDGESTYKGRCGVSIDPYGIFIARLVDVINEKTVLVENDPSLGKSKVRKLGPATVEMDRLFPIVRGRDIDKWHANPEYLGIIINSSTRKEDIPLESEVKRLMPFTYQYLNSVKDEALLREKFWQFFSYKHSSSRPLSKLDQRSLGSYVRATGKNENGEYVYEIAKGPFYTLFNVGPYTFSKYKVVWPMGAAHMKAAVVSNQRFEIDGKKTPLKPIIPATGTTSYVPFESLEEAHFVCAILNSSIVDAYIQSFSSAGRGFGAPSIVSKFAIPKYDKKNKIHKRLSDLSQQCHLAASEGDTRMLVQVEAEVNKIAPKLWHLTDKELRVIEDANESD